MSELKARVIEQLKEVECVKFGEFKLKSGIISPIYVELREVSRHPSLWNNIVELAKLLIPKDKQFVNLVEADRASPPVEIVGVPYGVFPIAIKLASACNLRFCPIRKETKDYGLKPESSTLGDGEFIIVEDVVSTGSSIIETFGKLDKNKVTDVIVVVDRQLGGMDKLRALYPQTRFHSILKVEELLAGAEESKSN